MGKAYVVSCGGLVVDAVAHRAEIGGVPLVEGDWVSVDSDTGEVFLGQLEIATERPEALLAEIETWREDAAKHHGPRGGWHSGVSHVKFQWLVPFKRTEVTRRVNRLDCDSNM
jgi:hypothetical protein